MKTMWRCIRGALAAGVIALAGPAAAAPWTLVGWNNLGMHCTDGDFSVFSLLPPYNTIAAQLVDGSGQLVTNPTGITVTYQAIADPDGSINSTSVGKLDFADHVQELFGVALGADQGLAGFDMPGPLNQPQAMSFDAAFAWFSAPGIPITPYDDAGQKNYYPMMRLTARSGGTLLASTDIVLPVSDEMACGTCHGSGAGPAARPAAGWINDPDPQRDFRLNILRLHDERQAGDPVFIAALAAAQYNPAGLLATVQNDGRSILCANCHASEALAAGGRAGVKPLTEALHGLHASVVDPANGLSLDAVDNRAACYRCHPGSVTRCLRGAMGSAVAADGTLAMQCQSCHGSMSDVGLPGRHGWLDEPGCQSCHTGTAVHNNGQIRYTTALDNGAPRTAIDDRFATTPDTPAAGVSLYRFSTGHGGLQCEACHGSTHAEFPAAHANDNVQSLQHQGHVGMFVECSSCHGTQPDTVAGGPHGMHPVGSAWVSRHPDAVEQSGSAGCRDCHGADYRGTVLSRALGDRTLSAFGGKYFWRGFQIGCYACHRGPNSETANPNRPAVVSDGTATTAVDTPVGVTLVASDADGNPLTLRIISQPAHGRVGLAGTIATYFPDAGFTGVDRFTFAAWDGATDSNLGTITLGVGVALPSPTPTTTGSAGPSPTPTVTANPLCGSAARSDCRTAGSDLLLFNHDGSARDTLLWKWNRGQATAVSDLADPLAGTAYALCLYAGGARFASLTVPPAGGRWQSLGEHGYAYRDRAGSAQGVQKVVLKAGDDTHAKLLLKGRGLALPDPVAAAFALPVVAQLVNPTSGVCWESRFAAARVQRNDASHFKAK